MTKSINKIPEDWKIKKLEEICEKIKSGGTPLTTVKEYYGGNIKFVKIEDLTNSKKYLSDTSISITEKGLNGSNCWMVPENSILIAIYGSLGSTSINKIPVTTNQAILGIIPDKKKLDGEFLYYFFVYSKSRLLRHAKHTTQANLTLEIIENLEIPLPPLPEQRAIAAVLSTMDEAIQKVEESIEKTERLKKGMMQKLLTKGIGHKKFKETEIGRIPEGWEAKKIMDIAEIRSNSSINNLQEIAFIPMELVPESQTFANYQMKKRDEVKSFTYCEAGDLLLAKITPSLENGKQGIVPLDIPNNRALATTEVFPINCKNVDRFFLFYVLKSSKFRNKIISSMIGSTGRQRASKDSVEKLKIPIPPIQEQKKIASILSTVDRKLELERSRKERLERVKKGLMNDLLTGKKRVKVK